MDNSPRFDGPYSRVQPGELAPYERTDLKHADASERPSAEEYDRYLWLVQQMAEVGFDDKRVLEVVDFRVRDVFMSGVMSTACGSSPTSPTSWAGVTTRPTNACCDAVREGVASTIDPEVGLARDYDVRTRRWIATETIAGFTPAGVSRRRAGPWSAVGILRGERWLRPSLRFALIPSTSPASDAYRPRTYWRGPVWPVMNWFFGWACRARGEPQAYEALCQQSLAQLADPEFGEYYEPSTENHSAAPNSHGPRRSRCSGSSAGDDVTPTTPRWRKSSTTCSASDGSSSRRRYAEAASANGTVAHERGDVEPAGSDEIEDRPVQPGHVPAVGQRGR